MSIYGHCENCQMELVNRDSKVGTPPGICESCFTLEMNEEPEIYTPVIDIAELWKNEDESEDTTS